METDRTYTAFSGTRLIVSADLKTVLLRIKHRFDEGDRALVLIFDDHTGKQVDFDLRGTPEEMLARLPSHPLFTAAQTPRPGPGRPKLGVTSREVSLLPRHWEWLEKQPQGISAVLRKLIEQAKRRDPDQERAAIAREAAGNFMWAMGGNLPGFEEASRAFYAMDETRLEELIRNWPEDVRRHLRRLLQIAAQLAVGNALRS